MGLLGRRRGMLGTMAALGDTNRAERDLGMDLLQDAEAVFVALGAPSRLGTALVTLALNGVGFDEQTPGYGAYLGSALMGYACRMAQPAPLRPEARDQGA